MTEKEKLLSELTDQEKALAFYKEIKKDIPNFITASLCVIGNEMERVNARTMKTSTEATFNGKRYSVKAKFTLKEIKQ